MTFWTAPTSTTQFNSEETGLDVDRLQFTISGGACTSIASATVTLMNVLDTGTNYSTPYTPQYNGSPATKKYVDDHDTVVSGDSGVVYTVRVRNSNPTS